MKVRTWDSFVRDRGFKVQGSMVPVEEVAAFLMHYDQLKQEYKSHGHVSEWEPA
jgi:hypothetical protein